MYPLGKTIPESSVYPAWTLEQASSQRTYYGIPQMVCMDTLFYRKEDLAVAPVQTMQQLYEAIGPRKTQRGRLRHCFLIGMKVSSLISA